MIECLKDKDEIRRKAIREEYEDNIRRSEKEIVDLKACISTLETQVKKLRDQHAAEIKDCTDKKVNTI